MLISIGEEVTLVVGNDLAIGFDEVEAVVETSVFLDGHTATDGSFQFGSHILHPFERTAVLLGNVFGLDGEACGEHLWQHIHIALVESPKDFRYLFLVGSRIAPHDIILQQGYFHTLIKLKAVRFNS